MNAYDASMVQKLLAAIENAADSATLGQTGVSIGSAWVLGGINFLAMNVGEKRAKEISFLCRRYPASEALELGWINTVVPDDRFEAAARKNRIKKHDIMNFLLDQTLVGQP